MSTVDVDAPPLVDQAELNAARDTADDKQQCPNRDLLFNVTVIVLPAIFIVPLFVLSLKHMGLVLLDNDSKVGVFVYSLLYLGLSLLAVSVAVYAFKHIFTAEELATVTRPRTQPIGVEVFTLEPCPPSVTSVDPTVTTLELSEAVCEHSPANAHKTASDNSKCSILCDERPPPYEAVVNAANSTRTAI